MGHGAILSAADRLVAVRAEGLPSGTLPLSPELPRRQDQYERQHHQRGLQDRRGLQAVSHSSTSALGLQLISTLQHTCLPGGLRQHSRADYLLNRNPRFSSALGRSRGAIMVVHMIL